MKYIQYALATLMFGLTPIAYSESQQPAKCPSVDAIQSSQSHVWINKNGINKYIGFLDIQKYDTDRDWSIIIWDIDATSMSEAERQAKYALSTLSFLGGPSAQSADVWRCLYKSVNGYYVITYTQ